MPRVKSAQNYGAFLSGLVALTERWRPITGKSSAPGFNPSTVARPEAARSLGMSYGQTMKFVIVPQAFRRMLPPLGNEASCC